MKRETFTPCLVCTARSEVETTDEGIIIVEDENTIRLSYAECNELVRLVNAGELHEV